MSNTKKRAYNSQDRDAKALATRNRILSSAKTLFQTEGFECVTIEKIAKSAKVSIPTVYSLFQSKRGILRAIMDEALPSEAHATLVEEARQEKSPEKRLFITAKIARQLYDAERAQMDIFQGASMLAPEFKELEKEREMRRYKRLEKPFQTMVKEKSLAKGLKPRKALDILWSLTGRDLYRMLVIEQGWSSDAYEKWLAKLLTKALLT